MSVDVRQIVALYLLENGFHGLGGVHCGCRLTELMPCDGPQDRCKPGYLVPCDCGDHDWHIRPMREQVQEAPKEE